MKNVQCICCGTILEMEEVDNPLTIPPVYDGLVFRASGNYGSTVHDPTPYVHGHKEQILQVVICDKCIKTGSGRVFILHDIKRQDTAKIRRFK